MVRMFAASSLGQLGQLPELGIPPLTNATQDVNEFVRMNAVQAIGNFIENSDSSASRSAVESLARRTMFSESCIPALINALRDSREFVRLSAATSIGKFQAAGSNAVPALIDALNDSAASVRGNATNALDRISPETLCRSKQRSLP